jgi:hypothetical protein
VPWWFIGSDGHGAARLEDTEADPGNGVKLGWPIRHRPDLLAQLILRHQKSGSEDVVTAVTQI